FPAGAVVLPQAIEVVAVAGHAGALQYEAARSRRIELVVIADELDLAHDRAGPRVTCDGRGAIDVRRDVRPLVHRKVGGDGFAGLDGDRLRDRRKSTPLGRN